MAKMTVEKSTVVRCHERHRGYSHELVTCHEAPRSSVRRFVVAKKELREL
jgi:hypothetical protein